jgi:hypothetical protein
MTKLDDAGLVHSQTLCGKVSYFANDLYFVKAAKDGKVHEQDTWLTGLKNTSRRPPQLSTPVHT